MKCAGARPAAAAGLIVLVAFGIAGCGPPPIASAKASPIPSSATQASPDFSPNPTALEPNDCTAAPAITGAKVHSPVLSATVRLPAGWAENPADEGQQGLEAGFDVISGSGGPNGLNISGDLMPSTWTMNPHDTVDWMISQPGSATVVAKGDCKIAGGKAAYFLSTISVSVFPGITKGGAGYSLIIAHGQSLVYVVVLLPAVNDPGMSDVKSILGSWQWDHS